MTDTDTDPLRPRFSRCPTVVERAVAAAPRWRALDPAARAGMLRAVADAWTRCAMSWSPCDLREPPERDAASRGARPDDFPAAVPRRGDRGRRPSAGLHRHARANLAARAARPDLRRWLRPLGPVAVFAASNFPFAFSVAGGDTASALAAGCPVVVKAHPGHLQLSARCGEIVTRGASRRRRPGRAPSLWSRATRPVAALVTHPDVAAVAFTGSAKVGRMLFDLAVGRPKPIPFYGELGSVNPVFVTRRAAATRLDEILSGYVASFSLGAGQFCTQPGILLLPAGVARSVIDFAPSSAPRHLPPGSSTTGSTPPTRKASRRCANRPGRRGHRRRVPRIPTARRPRPCCAPRSRILSRTPSISWPSVSGRSRSWPSTSDESQLIEVAETLEGQLTADRAWRARRRQSCPGCSRLWRKRRAG